MLKLGIYCRTQPLGKLVCESKLTDLTEDGLLGMILRMVTTRPCQHQQGHRHRQEKISLPGAILVPGIFLSNA